jgi:GcrA cell cycle regulator
MTSIWTPELVRQLSEFWDFGLSTKEMARKLNISKGAIIGKVHRLGLTQRPSPLPKWRQVDRPIITGDQRKSEKLGCRWIDGDPQALKAASGESYCEAHHARCYTIAPARNHKPFLDLQSAPKEAA